MIRSWMVIGLALLGVLSSSFAGAEPELRAGTIIMGVPRAHFVVLGADRFWTSALPRPDDTLAERLSVAAPAATAKAKGKGGADEKRRGKPAQACVTNAPRPFRHRLTDRTQRA